MRPMLRGVLALVTIVPILGGCTLAKISGRGVTPMMLNSPAQQTDVIAHITESEAIYFDYTAAFDVSEVLAERLVGSDADAFVNVSITVKQTFANWAVNLITLGLAQAKTFEVEGDLVRMAGGVQSLQDAGYERLGFANDSVELSEVLDRSGNVSPSMFLVREVLPDGKVVLAVWGER